MPEGKTENLDGLKKVYEIFNNKEYTSEIIRSDSSVQIGNREQEDESKTLERLYNRMAKGVNTLRNMISINSNMPAIVPLVPGYNNEEFNSVVSQLDKDVIKETAPQIKAIIEDARRIIEDRTKVKMSNKVIPLGHSKSATFANNFSAYYPEMCAACILGGGSFGTLPIDSVELEIVSDDTITENEKFLLKNDKIVTKKITKSDFDKVKEEYNRTKRDYQDEITINEDGTYNLPMNFPVGISDIENYRDLSGFPDGKEGFRKILTNMNKMIFIGEQEETIPGHFAYKDTTFKEGNEVKEVKAGDDIKNVTGIEVASMHNRVLEYIAASNSLFGRSTNERLNSYMQLHKLLGSPVQSKIYKDVGHANYNYSEDEKNSENVKKALNNISSKSIYASESLKKDIGKYSNAIVKENIPNLDDIDRASRISPVHQIIRRYIASRKGFKCAFRSI